MSSQRTVTLRIAGFALAIVALGVLAGSGPQDDAIGKPGIEAGQTDPRAYLPDNASFVIHVNVADALKVDWVKQLHSEGPGLLSLLDSSIRNWSKLKLDDIHSITWAGATDPRQVLDGEMLTIINTNRDVTVADLHMPDGEAGEVVGRYTIHQKRQQVKPACLVSARTIIRGREEVLKATLLREGRPTMDADAAVQVNELDLSRSIMTFFVHSLKLPLPRTRFPLPTTIPFEEIRAIVGTVDMADAVRIVGKIACSHEGSSKAYTDIFGGLLALEKAKLAKMSDAVSHARFRLVNAVQVTQAGDEVVVSMTVPSETIMDFQRKLRVAAGQAVYKPRIVDVYYYDLGTGKLFLAKSNQIPPIESPSGPGPNNIPQGVRAYVFSCGDCGDKTQQFVGWLEMYTPDAKQALTGPRDTSKVQGPEYYELWERGHLVSMPGTNKWVRANSEDGFKVMESMQSRCGPQGHPKPCFPGRN